MVKYCLLVHSKTARFLKAAVRISAVGKKVVSPKRGKITRNSGQSRYNLKLAKHLATTAVRVIKF